MSQYAQDRKRGFGFWLARGLSLMLALVLAFAAGAVFMHVGMHSDDQAKIRSLQSELADSHAEMARLLEEQSRLQGEAEFQDGTRLSLLDEITRLRHQLDTTQNELSFYEQLIPPGPADSITVRAFDARKENNYLHYRVLLTRNVPLDTEPFNGRMRFIAEGTLDGKATEIELSAASVAGDADSTLAKPARQDSASGAGADNDGSAGSAPASEQAKPDNDTAITADPLTLDFDRFQRSTGLLQLAPGLQIAALRVEILEGDSVRASQRYDLNVAASPAAPGT